jgi:hypothetical protein
MLVRHPARSCDAYASGSMESPATVDPCQRLPVRERASWLYDRPV